MTTIEVSFVVGYLDIDNNLRREYVLVGSLFFCDIFFSVQCFRYNSCANTIQRNETNVLEKKKENWLKSAADWALPCAPTGHARLALTQLGHAMGYGTTGSCPNIWRDQDTARGPLYFYSPT